MFPKLFFQEFLLQLLRIGPCARDPVPSLEASVATHVKVLRMITLASKWTIPSHPSLHCTILIAASSNNMNCNKKDKLIF